MAQKRKKKGKRKFIGIIFLVLLLCSGIICFCLFTPFFNIEEIAVLGNETVASEEILQSSGIMSGTNIFRTGSKKVKESLSVISRIDDVKLKRRLPKRVDIIVTETAPQLIIPYMTGYVVINERGKVIEIADDVSALSLPHIEGIKIKDAQLSMPVVPEDKVGFEMVMECISILFEDDALKLFRSLDFSNLSNFSAVTHEGTKIIFGKMEELDYKLKFIGSIMPNVDKKDGTYIDVSDPSKGVYGSLADIQKPITEVGEENEEEIKSSETPEDTEENNGPEGNETGE